MAKKKRPEDSQKPVAQHMPPQQQDNVNSQVAAQGVFHNRIVRIAQDGDLLMSIGPRRSARAFLVDSHFLASASEVLKEKTNSNVRMMYVSDLRRSCRVAYLPQDKPEVFESLLLKLHRSANQNQDGTKTSEQWLELSMLAERCGCTQLLWFEADYYLRTQITPWSNAGDTEKLWDGFAVAFMMSNAEWFRHYSARLARLHQGPFSKIGSGKIKKNLTRFKLARMAALPFLPQTPYCTALGSSTN